MGKKRLENIKGRFSDWKDRHKEAKELKIMRHEGDAVYKLMLKFMQEDGLTWEEIQDRAQNDPNYSYWIKYQRSFVWMIDDPVHMKKHRDEFLASLTPEEMEIHNREETKEAMKAAEEQLHKAKKDLGDESNTKT